MLRHCYVPVASLVSPGPSESWRAPTPHHHCAPLGWSVHRDGKPPSPGASEHRLATDVGQTWEIPEVNGHMSSLLGESWSSWRIIQQARLESQRITIKNGDLSINNWVFHTYLLIMKHGEIMGYLPTLCFWVCLLVHTTHQLATHLFEIWPFGASATSQWGFNHTSNGQS